ncbi:MAG: DUF2851 family protein [Bacteroidia bacterium]|nr:DUF2851 family protein [Bacteroidia bacterium]
MESSPKRTRKQKSYPSRVSELLLHWIWRNRLFESAALRTLNGQAVEIIETGTFHPQGPDFQGVKARIDGVLWIGSAEVDIAPDSWYAHKHHENPAHRSTILHIVWDTSPHALTIDMDGREIPILPLAPAVQADILQRLHTERPSFPCASLARLLPESDWISLYETWGEKRLISRHRTYRSERELFEAFWRALLYSFGAPDGQVFQLIAESLPWTVFTRSAETLVQKEATLFGIAGLMENLPAPQHPYERELSDTWRYLKRKHNWCSLKIRFRPARPAASPWIRLAQAAALIHTHPKPAELLLHPPAALPVPSPYWLKHWAWQKPLAIPLRAASPFLYQNILINVLYPFGIYYLRYLGRLEEALDMVDKFRRCAPENHTYARLYAKWAYPARSAWQTQGQIQLWRDACQLQACLSCPIGKAILTR